MCGTWLIAPGGRVDRRYDHSMNHPWCKSRSMTAIGAVVAAALSMIVPEPARAQPGATTAQPPPAPEPEAAPIDEPRAPAADEAASAEARSDGLGQAYALAFEAMLQGDFATAQRGFAMVAAKTTDPEQRRAAQELDRLAAALLSRGAKLALEAAPRIGTAIRTERDREDEDDGRTTFIATTTMTGLYAGIVLIDLLNIDDARPGVALVSAATAAGLLGSLYGSKGHTITAAQADAYSLGIGLGAGNALLLASPLGLTDTSERMQTFILGSMIGGGALGMYLGHAAKPTRAQVAVTGSLGVMSLATVGLGIAIANPSDISGDTVLTLMATGLDAGIVGGLLTSQRLDWSLSRSRLVTLGSFLGALGGVAGSILILGEPADGDEGRIVAASTLAGMWGGFALTAHLTRDMRPDSRYATVTPAAREATVVPTVVRGAPGLSVAGTF